MTDLDSTFGAATAQADQAKARAADNDDAVPSPNLTLGDREILRNQVLMMMALVTLSRVASARGVLSPELKEHLEENHERLDAHINRLLELGDGWINFTDAGASI